MGLITSVILILAFIVIYVIVIQIYSVLFRITGLTKEKARFQAISLLTNSGFTTSESEIIVSDRVRRRIAIAAMINGYAFSVIIPEYRAICSAQCAAVRLCFIHGPGLHFPASDNSISASSLPGYIFPAFTSSGIRPPSIDRTISGTQPSCAPMGPAARRA